MTVTIRDARRADRPAISALSAATLADHRSRFPDHFPAGLSAQESFLDALFARKTRGFALVAERDGRIVGWSGLAIFDVPASEKTHDRLGIVMDITVAAYARGEGIATALLSELKQRAMAADVTLLQADAWLGGPSSGVLSRAGLVPVKTVHDARLAPSRKGAPPGQRLKSFADWFQAVALVAVAGVLLVIVTKLW